MDTELKLLHWREGDTKAERLCANVLQLDGFSSVDPQCPLGGPDGLKDVLCEKNNWKYIGAAYFSIEQQSFANVKSKFVHDLEGVNKNSADGIVFLTNQKLSPTERKKLIEIAEKENSKAILYHRERIRVILDTPIGFAIRLEYLGIEMSREEQLSFFSQQTNILEDLLKDSADYIIKALSRKIDGINSSSATVHNLLQTIRRNTENIQALTMAFQEDVSKEKKKQKEVAKFPVLSKIGNNLNVDLIKFIHKTLLFEETNINTGNFRSQDVWLGNPKSTPETALYVPPAFDKVPALLDKLIADWNLEYDDLKKRKDRKEIVSAIAQFHFKFLSIHPFLDGNKRVSRFLLNQQVNELLDIDRKLTLENNKTYINAFLSANKGDMEPLKDYITQSIFGEEEIE